jgi:hypothetical protein
VTIIKGEAAVCAWNGTDFIKVSNISGPGTFTDLTVTGNTSLGDADTDTITQAASYVTGTQLKSAKTATNTLNLAAYDTDGVAYTNLITLTASTTPTLALTSTGVGTINNMSVGATTASTGAFTTLSATGVATFSAGTAALPAITTTGDTNTGIFFPAADTIAFTEGGAEAMRIDSSGNVGIGTSSPAYRLDVGANSVAANIHSYGSITSGTLAGYSIRTIPRLTNDTGTFENTYIGCGASVGNIIFQQGNSFTTASNTERMRIDSSGNLLVGGASIPGSGNVRSSIGAGLFCFTAYQSGTTAFTAFQVVNGNGEIGSITTSATTTSYNTSSDYRLKEEIAPMTGALVKVAALKPCTYKWKVDGSEGQGFIAHELDEVVSGCVTGAKDAVDADGNPKYQGVDTSFLVATLTAAIQEQQALITSLTARVAALEAN